mmetsp:Transcript_30318/g.35781  ORF Transcript_30318/g.35781 Transcript_30318/m.35781 type:complete len:159 (+) Transcript_30318:15-491(+)
MARRRWFALLSLLFLTLGCSSTNDHESINSKEPRQEYRTEIYKRKKKHSKKQDNDGLMKFGKHILESVFGVSKKTKQQRKQKKKKERQQMKKGASEAASFSLKNELDSSLEPDTPIYLLSSKQAAKQHVEEHLGHHRRRRRKRLIPRKNVRESVISEL